MPRKKTIQTLSNSNHRVHRRSGPAVPRAHLRGHSADHFHPSRCEGRPTGPCYLRRRPLTRPHTCRPAHPPQPTRPRPPRPHSSLVRHAAENRRLVRSSSASVATAAVATWRSSGQPLNSLNESRDVTVAIYQLNPLLS